MTSVADREEALESELLAETKGRSGMFDRGVEAHSREWRGSVLAESSDEGKYDPSRELASAS